MNHAKIEEEEDEKVREFTGEDLPPLDANQIVLDALAGRRKLEEAKAASPSATVTQTPTNEEIARQARKLQAFKQAEKFGKSSREASKRGDWGDEGFARPRDMADRLRKDVPFKFKVKKSWFGEF